MSISVEQMTHYFDESFIWTKNDYINNYLKSYLLEFIMKESANELIIIYMIHI